MLREIGADHLPLVQVYNKADILGRPPQIDRAETGMPRRVWLSAETGDGIDALLSVIGEYLHVEVVRGTVSLGVSEARLRALLYETGKVLDERSMANGGWELDVELDRRGYQELQRRENLKIQAEDKERRPAVAN